MRLKPMAAKRAAVNAISTSNTVRHATRDSNDAYTMPTRAKGRANTVCGSFTKFA